MDNKQIQKIKHYLNLYLERNSEFVLQKLGLPHTYYENNEVWFYNKRRNFILKDEIAFLMKDDIVDDIIITEYIFGIPLRNIFYYKNHIPEFKIVFLLFKNKLK